MTQRDEIIKLGTFEEFCRISSDWDLIANQYVHKAPFLCHGWFEIWVKHFATEQDLCIFTLTKEDGFIAIVPCIKKNDKYRGIVLDKYELMGNAYSPIRSLIFDPAMTEQAVEKFFSNFAEQRNLSWDILDLSSLPEESPFFECIRKYLMMHNFHFSEYLSFGDWYQDGITCSGGDYLAGLPEKIQKDFQYCKRRLEREGKLEFRVVTSIEHLESYLDRYYEVYGRSWQKQERLGPTFHRDLARMAVLKGWLRLAFLYFNDIPLAAQFWIVSGGTAYILKTVYDQEYKKYSPGKILTSEMFKYVIDVDKVTTIDYVQGDEDYKKYWTPKRRERRGILVYNDTLRGRYCSIVDRKIVPLMNSNEYLKKLKKSVSRRGRSSK
ncbi:MAG TPA: GNAT family N-acetyltransferase [Alphaproteobacteria bacterium]|nr:GNAT family N-acetyltransferase [Alphaproteobacteria bacterium]